jgi:hypothetical protein
LVQDDGTFLAATTVPPGARGVYFLGDRSEQQFSGDIVSQVDGIVQVRGAYLAAVGFATAVNAQTRVANTPLAAVIVDRSPTCGGRIWKLVTKTGLQTVFTDSGVLLATMAASSGKAVRSVEYTGQDTTLYIHSDLGYEGTVSISVIGIP